MMSTRPRRAVLYVPGNDMKKLTKSLTLKVDCVAMDCEDGVAINKKVGTYRSPFLYHDQVVDRHTYHR